MKNMIKDAAILFAITLVAGLILGVVYDITKAPIAEQEIKAKNQACQEVFGEASSFEEIELLAVNYDASGLDADAEVNTVNKALDNSGELLGYVLEVTTHEGYGGDITFAMGVTLEGTLNGISLLSISETPGLGMKAEEVLKPQFAGKTVSQFQYTKSGATADNQIDAISGATITTNAVTGGVNTGLWYFSQLGGSAK